MWSAEATGRSAPLGAPQRVLFAVDDGTEQTRRQLLRGLRSGRCRAVALADVGDAQALRAVRAALEAASAGDEAPAVDRGQVAVVAATPQGCGAQELLPTVENALATLRAGRIDVLLLSARSLPPTAATEHALFARKRLLVEYWGRMLQLREAGVVTHVGVSDFAIQDVELLMSSFPADIPVILGVSVGLATSSKTRTSLQTFKTFAHGAGIDLLVRLAFSDLDDLPLTHWKKWAQVCQSISQRNATMEFQHLVTHELEKGAEFHVEKAILNAARENNGVDDDSCEVAIPLGSSALIVLRYLLQLGLVVVPVVGNTADDTIDDVFLLGIHPFADMHPAYSPHKAYSSVLATNEVKEIQSELSFTVLQR